MLKPRVSLTSKTHSPERLFWARQHLLRFHLIQNKRMLGLNFAHLGNGFSYLGHSTRRLRGLTRARWAAAFPNEAQLIHPLAALSSTLKGQIELNTDKTAYLQGRYLFSLSTSENLANTDFNATLFSTGHNTFVPFINNAAALVAAPAATQLSLFVRLNTLRDLSFYIFINLNVKLKFVLFAFAPLPLRGVLFNKFPLPKFAPSYPFLK